MHNKPLCDDSDEQWEQKGSNNGSQERHSSSQWSARNDPTITNRSHCDYGVPDSAAHALERVETEVVALVNEIKGKVGSLKYPDDIAETHNENGLHQAECRDRGTAHSSFDLEGETWLEACILTDALAVETLIDWRVHDHGKSQEVTPQEHKSQVEVSHEIGRIVNDGRCIVDTSILYPVDRADCDHAFVQDFPAKFEGQGADKHDHELQPEGVLFENPNDWHLGLKVLSEWLFIDHAILDLALDDWLVESNGVLVVLPHRLKVVLEDYRDAAHYRDDKHDEISEEANRADITPIGSSMAELRLPLDHCHNQTNDGKKGHQKIQILPMPVVSVVFLDELASDGVVFVLK